MAEVNRPLVFDGKRLALRAAVVAIVGFVLLAIGVATDPARAWLSYLMAFVFAFTIAVGGLIFLLLGYATNARWMAMVRRSSEIVTLPLPALALLFVPILFGLGWIYPWHTPPADLSHHELQLLEHRAPYLNTAALVIRAIVYFTVLLTASLLLRRWSIRRDARDDAERTARDAEASLARERRFASGMLPAVGLAFTFASIDWVMALEPVWYSSMFPVYLFAGGFLAAISLVTILTDRLRSRACDPHPITPNHFHALGRMLFAFTVFWTYAAFFQALLIGIADKPEEVVFYAQRTEGAWAVVVWILILGHFALPFLGLLTRSVKFRPIAMAIAGWWLLGMHLVDIYWLVIPSRDHGAFVVHWLDLAALAAVGGTAVAVAAWRQHGVPLLAIGDPFLPEGAAYRSRL
jgi:hypothetical protein